MALLLVVLGMPLLLSCTGSMKQAPLEIHYYTIEYDPPARVDTASLPYVIKVGYLPTSPLYDSNRIVFKTGEFSRDEYVYHKWKAPPGELISFFLARDISETGHFRAALYADSVSPYTHLVTGTIEAFYQHAIGNEWESVLAMTITLIDNAPPKGGDHVMFQKKYSARKPLSNRDPSALAQAMSGAMQQISAEIVDDIYTLLSQIE